ncbi:unnamed protein product [Peronospora belbahrii]|uniref:Uncharacterized protein n=1 Tax=Peronospora belbahrii TaxID=622444 RepID=A0AAU9KI98_9STRA|nr:unnamed protein product [Peronospora belbahrii]CAH0520581.1 unnamed protein product [Peronospora belbahrii]
MNLSEDVDENELIDAFDALEPNVPVSTKSSFNTSTQQKNAFDRQPTRSNGQECHMKTKIPVVYPTFNDSNQEVPVVTASTSSQPKQHQMIHLKEQKCDTSLPAQRQREEQVMTELDLERKRQRVEREMRIYQERFDYIAQALAGKTPHQIQERKKREEERLQRQERRHEVVKTRLQHQLKDVKEKEEHRARLETRHRQSSRSLSIRSDRERDLAN